jgi:methionine-rich copper-binding protein CopC
MIARMSKSVSAIIPFAFLLASPWVWAHSHLVEAHPSANQVVKEAPAAVTLRFSEKIEPAFSGIEVRSLETGKSVTQGKAQAPHGAADRLEIDLQHALPPGGYEVEWKATSLDTHRTHGKFRFMLKPPTAGGAGAGAHGGPEGGGSAH